MLNLVCAGLALPLIAGLFLMTPPPATAAGPPRGGTAVPGTFGQGIWMALYALSGFLAMSFEIVWFRLLGVMLKSTAFTFGTLLAQYLFWLGAGSALGSLVTHRLQRPAIAFLAAQMGAAAYAGMGLLGVLRTIEQSPSLAWVRDYFGQYEPMRVANATSSIRGFLNDVIWHTPEFDELPYEFRWRYFVLPALLIGPATLLMGLGFPLMQRVVQTDLAHLGRRVGTLLLANIVGSTLGALVTGWMFLTWFGTSGTLKLLIVLSATFGHVR